jgi:hypothetical protein
MAQYQLKKQFQNGRLIVDGVELDSEFFSGNVEQKIKAFPAVAAFIEEVPAPKAK